MTPRTILRSLAICAFPLMMLLLATSCGGGGSKDAAPTAPVTPPVDLTKPTAVSVTSGSGQTVRIKSAVPTPITFKVTNVNGSGLAGISISFAVAGGGGSLAGSSATTAADGTVTLPAWTMGAVAGTNTVSATVGALSTSASATARNPLWTVMVFMAADNNLAVNGVINLEQMEAVGANDEVQVVMQAEFSRANLTQYGISSASQLNLISWNTFRYALPKGAATNNVLGPNLTVQDIGSRDMTSPTELSGFVTWAAQQAPAEHYALVLWNHGNGAFGLLSDETTNPSNQMSLSQLKSALAAGPKLDVTIFDMCLMGTIETVAALRGSSKTALFSQELIPGEGFDYEGMLRTFQQNSTAATTTIASALVDAYFQGYATNTPPSITMTAVSVDAADPVLSAWDALGATLQGMPSSSVTSVAAAVSHAQRYKVPLEKDFADVLDSVRTRLTDTPTRAAIDALRSQLVAPTFLLRTRYRNGTDGNATNVTRSKGLSVAWPSGLIGDAMFSSGPSSLSGYSANSGMTSWNTFLSRYLTTALYAQVVDLGTNPLSWVIAWSASAMSNGADIDLWIFEPTADGSGWDTYSPSIGTVTPNGDLTPDSYTSNYPIEGWVSRRYIQRGLYYLGAYLYNDPKNVQPTLNVLWRRGFTSDFSALYTGTLPKLTTATRFMNDPSPTMTKLLGNAYTDFRIVSNWDLRSAAAATVEQATASSSAFRSMTADNEGFVPSQNVPTDARPLTLTSAQIATMRAAIANRRNGLSGSVRLPAQMRAVLPLIVP